ncbi:hypothetical protein [Actinomadura darangshiensis]|uniref:hypothetical protein n=1 Tax=Actinomadura darangshiensis TaxID=705336 RepID=UPI001A9CD947|nr:hypothetical protein [Actinomadura darangshiensis]
MPARHDGGALRGGAPRAVWCAGEYDPRTVSARSVAADLVKEDRPAHLVWHPGTGEIVQLLPITRAARLLGACTGREGRVCAQLVVVAQSRTPFTGSPLAGLDAIVQWLEEWGVARRWPAGPPLPSPQSYHAHRSRKDWARGGHYGASQVPLLDRPDPGGIDVRRVTGPDTPLAAIPRPRVSGTTGGPRLLPRPRPQEPVRPPQTDPPPGRSAPLHPASEPVPVGPSAMSN